MNPIRGQIVDNLARYLLLSLFLVACGRVPIGHAPVAPSPESIPRGWVSSGGERFGDSLNPWWLGNVSEVPYCVQIDPATFSLPVERVRPLVRAALDFWALEFTGHPAFVDEASLAADFNPFGVATQKFTEVPCGPAVELRFQLGYGALDANQRAYFGDPARYVALTVRTGYDEERLHGRGFVYVASDSGARSFTMPNLRAGFWKSEPALFLVLVHELGHVFGIPHIGVFERIMSQKFPEVLLQYLTFGEPLRIRTEAVSLPSFFFPVRRGAALPPERARYSFAGSLTGKPELRTLFGLPAGGALSALNLTYTSDTEVALRTEEAEVVPKAPTLRAVGALKGFRLSVRRQPVVLLQYNPKQKVFPWESYDTPYRLRTGPFLTMLEGSASLEVTRPGELARPVFLRWSSMSGLSVFATIGGKVEELLTNTGMF